MIAAELFGSLGAEAARFARLLDEVLASTSVCSVASVSTTNSAHINTAYFAPNSNLILYILTPPTTQHAQNWLTNPSAAVAAFDAQQTWNAEHRGAQLLGIAAEVSAREHAAAYDRYVTAHPALRELAPDAGAVLRDLDSRFFAIEVDAVRLYHESAFGEQPFAVRVTRRQG
jgi:uncharacterized protein YhbP (UPF0306 family)